MYIPENGDITWAIQMMALVMESGVLGFPSSGLIYRVSHFRKKLTLLNPDQLINPASLVTHLRTVVVFKEIGYAVTSPEPTESEPPFG